MRTDGQTAFQLYIVESYTVDDPVIDERSELLYIIATIVIIIYCILIIILIIILFVLWFETEKTAPKQ